MNRPTVLRLLAVLFITIGPAALNAAADDQQALRGVVKGWEDAWSAHDARALGELFTVDSDFVNVAGLHWHGRTQIVDEHAERFQTNLKNSVWATQRITVQLVQPSLALNINWSMTGDTDCDGTPRAPRQGIMSWLAIKTGQRWQIRSAHNTNKSSPK